MNYGCRHIQRDTYRFFQKTPEQKFTLFLNRLIDDKPADIDRETWFESMHKISTGINRKIFVKELSRPLWWLAWYQHWRHTIIVMTQKGWL